MGDSQVQPAVEAPQKQGRYAEKQHWRDLPAEAHERWAEVVAEMMRAQLSEEVYGRKDQRDAHLSRVYSGLKAIRARGYRVTSQ